MSYLPPLPSELQEVEYVKLYFHLEVKDSFDLPELGLLQLRRELHQALRTLEGWGQADDVVQLKELLQPKLSADPLVRRQAQQPAPAFVLFPDPQLAGQIKPGQRLVLPAIFIGKGLHRVDVFVSLLQQLGQQGLFHGAGKFILEGLESEDASGVRAMLWSGGSRTQISPPVSDLHWLLERQRLNSDEVILEVISPMRLLQQKKPLFRADFAALFPFVLRRISSMLICHSGVEIIKNPQSLHDRATRVEIVDNCLQWRDWRRLNGQVQEQELGGLCGQLRLRGDVLLELLWLLELGSLFNVGKAAAYGAGQYRLRTYC